MLHLEASGQRKHPHVRGEDEIHGLSFPYFLETPPRAWGRQCIRASPGSHDGNTPTCVGKTRGPGHREPGMRKHPHVRGEDLSCRVTDTFKTETPPRAWGRRVGCRFLQTYGRNTPTCVGKTPRRFSACSRLGKHPHVRGEDNIGIRAVFRVGETPPRAWGRLRTLGVNAMHRRNTPTCVGKTLQDMRLHQNRRKHPHVRGEDKNGTLVYDIEKETPPRAWGRQQHGQL